MRPPWIHLIPIACLAAGLFAAAPATAQQESQAYAVVATVTVGDNQMGVKPGEQIFLDFPLDPDLTATRSLSVNNVLVFIDPWRWHWRQWDWLRGFIIRVPIIVDPRPGPRDVVIEAVFDDSLDMIMPMPGVPELRRGSAFVTTLKFPSDAAFFKEGRIPTMDELNKSELAQGSTFEVLDPDGKQLLSGQVTQLRASDPGPMCRADLDGDGDVDATDVFVMRREFGRNNCPMM